MAKSQALVAAEQRIAALEARLVVASHVYRDQRASIDALEAKLATRGVIAAAAAPAAVVTLFTRADGSVWQKTRIGSNATSHQVQPAINSGATA